MKTTQSEPPGGIAKWFESAPARFERTARDFDNPSQEWRRLFSEVLGTFFLVMVAAGGGMMGQAFPNTISRTAAVVAPALMVLGVILFMGKVSGAHLNPAVSFAFWLRGDFPLQRVTGYILAQLAGACLAAWFLQATIHVSSSFGSNYPASGFSGVNAFVMETARTFGPDAISADFGHYWVYVAGPVLGATIAVGVAFVLRGSGGGLAGSGAAQGAIHTEAIRPDQA